jgi:hypothetical protein
MEKRLRERVRRQKQLDKERRRAQRAAERRERQLKGSKDAELEGILPGPANGQMVELP